MDLAGNEVASILVTADADVSPLDRKLTQAEQRVNDAAARIDRTAARAGSQAFTGLEQATARVLSRVPLIGGVLAGVEQKASSLRQAFFSAGQATETAMSSARKQVESLASSIAQATSKLDSLRAKASLIQTNFASDAQRIAEAATRKTGASGITPDFLRQLSKEPSSSGRDQLILGATGQISQEMVRDLDAAASKYENLERRAVQSLATTRVAISDTEKELASLTTASTAAEQGVAALAEGGAGLGATFAAVAAPVALAVAAIAALVVGMGAAVYGAYSLATSAAQLGAKYQDLSYEVGLTAHELSGLEVLGSQVGVSFNQIGAALGQFDKKLESGAEGSTKLSRVLKDQGVDIKDNQKALEGMFRILSALPEGETKTGLAMEAFSRGGKAMLAIVKQANGDLPTAIKLLEQMGAVMSDKDAAAAQEFQAKQALLAAQFDVMKVKVGEEVMPVFEALFENLSKWLAQNGEDFKSWGQILGGVAMAAINWAHEVAVAWRDTLSVIKTVSSMQPSAKDDPHTGGQSYAGRAWDWLTGPNTSQWQAGTGQGTARMVSQQEAEAQGAAAKAEREAHDRAEASYQAYLQRVERDKAALAAHISGLMGQKSGGGRKGGGDAAANRMAEAALQSAQIDLRNAESVYQTASQLAKAYYDLNLSDYRSYVAQMTALEGQRYKAQQDAFGAEETAASGLRGPKRDEKLKDINQREQAAEREHGVRLQQIKAENAQHDYDVQQQFAQMAVTLAEETQRTVEADLERQINAGTATNVDTVRARFAALGEVVRAQGAVLESALMHALGGGKEVDLLSGGGLDLRETISQLINDATNNVNPDEIQDAFKAILANAQNPEEVQKALDNIRQFILQRKQLFAQNQKDETDAQTKDLQSLQDYQKSLADITNSIVDLQRASEADRLKILEDASVRRRAVAVQQLAFDQQTERIALQRRVAELEAQRAIYETEAQYEAHRPELVAKIDEQIEAERQRSNQKQLNLWEDFISRQNEKLKSAADKAVGVLDSALNGLRQNGFKGFFQSLEQDFLSMILKWQEDLLKSKLLDILRQVTHTPAPGSAVTGGATQPATSSGGISLPGIFGALVNKIFHTGNAGASSSNGSADASAVSAAGSQATGAIKDGWTNSVQQIGKAGDKQVGAIAGVGQSIVSALAAIGSMLAAGAAKGSFWKGLLIATVSGFLDGLAPGLGRLLTGGGSAGAGGLTDDPTGIGGDGGLGSAAVGGLLKGPGTGTSDDILGVDRMTKQATAWVSNGEYIIKESSVKRLGVGVLDFINQMGRLPRAAMMPAFADGGPVMAGNPFSGYVPPVHNSSSSHDNSRHVTFHQEIHFDGNAQSVQTARKTARQIARASRSALAINN